MRIAVYVLLGLLLITLPLTGGCIFSKQAGTSWTAPSFKATPESSCVLGIFPDGGGADGVIPGSGELVRSKVRMELLKHGLNVVSGTSSEFSALLEEGRRNNVAYVVLGRLPIWEDNATGWSGKRDQAGLSLELYEVATGKLAASSDRTANGIRQPNECAPWLATEAVRALFGEPASPNGPPC
jgi:hypothetical protein